jgi:glyoxalase family protein
MSSAGIHHITAIAGNPQTNLDFYSGLLGLKFIKKTINFDDPGTYHFYFGDDGGSPGTILTFFPWGKNAHKGRGGRGQVLSYAFNIPVNSLDQWKKKLEKFKIIYTGPYERFGENLITIEDPDGIEIDLVEHAAHQNGSVDISGFHSASLSVESIAMSDSILGDIFGFKLLTREGNRYRYSSGSGGPGNIVDVIVSPDSLPGIMGVGAIHHIAFRAADDNTQQSMRSALTRKYISVTPVIDRKYFKSVYFREPNGILFEIATDSPGFQVDEPKESLGQKLQLPEWLEEKRYFIEKALQPLAPASPERIFLSE